MIYRKKPLPSNLFSLLSILIFCFLLSSVSCRPYTKISSLKKTKNCEWTTSEVYHWFKNKKKDLKQIVVQAELDYFLKDKKNELNAYLLLNNQGQGRIEILGPWKSPVYYLIFDPNEIYCYILNESRLYLAKNHPKQVEKLVGYPLNLSLLFDLIVSNFPSDNNRCSSHFSNNDNTYVCYSIQAPDIFWEALVIIDGLPWIKEMKYIRGDSKENVMILYSNMHEWQGYLWPTDLQLNWYAGYSLHLNLKSIKINQPTSPELFKPHRSWYLGDIIIIKDQ